MAKNTPVAIFMAATTAITAGTMIPEMSIASDNKGGLKEWTTDQDINEESKLDEAARKAAEKAKKNDVCIPIGEGENCW